MKRDKNGSRKQSQRFIEAARELGCDEDESHFEEKLKTIARQQPPDKPSKSKQSKSKEPGK